MIRHNFNAGFMNVIKQNENRQTSRNMKSRGQGRCHSSGTPPAGDTPVLTLVELGENSNSNARETPIPTSRNPSYDHVKSNKNTIKGVSLSHHHCLASNLHGFQGPNFNNQVSATNVMQSAHISQLDMNSRSNLSAS